MSRAIVTKPTIHADGASTRGVPDGGNWSLADDVAGPEEVDGYADKLIKLIPGEVVTVYLSMMTLLENSRDEVAAIVPWLVFGFGVLATWFYLRVTLKVSNRRQIGITVGAFFIWAFTLGAPFENLDWYNGTYAGLLLAAYTFIAPKIPLE
ncbi:MAG: hypothetical protein AB8G17_16235 [Gammaproteobacteria bacterium]